MKCPFCGYPNIPGIDECQSCNGDLSSLDGVVPKTKIEKVLMSDPISKLKPRKPVMISKGVSALEAVKKMNEAKVGCVLIVDQNQLEGVLTERDVVLKALDVEKDLSKAPVSKFMTENPETLSPEDTLSYAVNRMAVGGYRHIPILQEDVPVGIISIRDVLRYLSKLFSESA